MICCSCGKEIDINYGREYWNGIYCKKCADEMLSTSEYIKNYNYKRIIADLQAENAALRERLDKAVELPTERKVDDFYMEPYFGEIKTPLYDDDKAKVVIPMYVYFKFNSIGEAKQWLKEQQEK